MSYQMDVDGGTDFAEEHAKEVISEFLNANHKALIELAEKKYPDLVDAHNADEDDDRIMMVEMALEQMVNTVDNYFASYAWTRKHCHNGYLDKIRNKT